MPPNMNGTRCFVADASMPRTNPHPGKANVAVMNANMVKMNEWSGWAGTCWIRCHNHRSGIYHGSVLIIVHDRLQYHLVCAKWYRCAWQKSRLMSAWVFISHINGAIMPKDSVFGHKFWHLMKAGAILNPSWNLLAWSGCSVSPTQKIPEIWILGRNLSKRCMHN